MGRLGERFGRFLAVGLRRVEQAASGAPAAPAAPTATASSQGTAPPAEDGPPSRAADTVRAEEMVDRIGGQLSALASVAAHRLRKGAALAREEAEDMWAEAQQLRRDRDRNSS